MIAETSAKIRILNVADELFYQRGLHAVGVDEIVARSGVAKTTLYAHFKSKDLLIASYLQRRSDDWRSFLEHALRDSHSTAAEKIDQIFAFLADGCADPAFRGCPFINFMAEYADPDHPARSVCLEHRRWLHGFLAEIARDGGASDPGLMATQLCHLYDSAMTAAMYEQDDESAKAIRTTLCAIVSLAFSVDDPLAART
ncbi:MAG: TetR/AcrR family transcriptional regulator [Thermomicrobiales bacterium]